MSDWDPRSCPSLIVLSMVRTEEIGCFASKDTSGRSFEPRGRGASNGAMACSVLGGEPRGDRENTRQQLRIEQETDHDVVTATFSLGGFVVRCFFSQFARGVCFTKRNQA